MPPSTNFFRAAQQAASPGFARQFAGQARTATFQQRAAFFRSQFRQQNSRRWQSSDAGAGAGSQAQQSWFKRMWDSPIGFKTVHFWAPVMKWALVIAGISDFNRPAEKLSLTQNGALTATGLIWTRWCLIIKPKNYLLAAVNFFLGIVGVVQVTRILIHENSKKGGAVENAVEEVKDEVKKVEQKTKA